MSCAACSFAFSLSAAMLEARRSAAALAGSERPLDCTALSTAGAGWRSRAAAVEALVRGAMVEKSLREREREARQGPGPASGPASAATMTPPAGPPPPPANRRSAIATPGPFLPGKALGGLARHAGRGGGPALTVKGVAGKPLLLCPLLGTEAGGQERRRSRRPALCSGRMQ